MAKSASSQQHAQLIREMSKDVNRTTHSSGSSRHSRGGVSPEPTLSDFDPENEAMMSTRQLDNNAQQLPELRASAQKYSRFARPASHPEPDYAIDTSAIGRAFPDFSQGNASSDDSSVSIEIGRGAKKERNGTIGKLGRSREFSSNAQLNLNEDSLDFAAPMIDNYGVAGTPLKLRQGSRKTDESTRGSLRRDVQLRQASALQKEVAVSPPTKTRDYGSGASRSASGENRRTLAAMHARVRDENDMSRINDERPPTIELTVRNTRFANAKAQQAPSKQLPTNYNYTKGLQDALNPAVRSKTQAISTPDQGTQQSFMLPDMPNFSELVSGVYENGTPVFSRHGKSRTSRFASASQGDNRKGPQYAGVEEIPVPADEQAIFLSLKLLQDKVAELEKSRAEAESTIQELHDKNRALEDGQKQRKVSYRSDSALGTTDSDGGDDVGGGQRKSTIHRNRLESSVRALQTQADASNRKAATAENILKNITQERDSAVSQLGVVYFTNQQLKSENEGLRDENNELKARIAQLRSDHEGATQKRTAEEDAVRRNIDSRTEDVRTITKESAEQSPAINDGNTPVTRFQYQGEASGPNQRKANKSTFKDLNPLFDLSSQQANTKEASRGDPRKDAMYDSQESEDSVYEAPTMKGDNKSSDRRVSSRRSRITQTQDLSQELTYLSFLDNDEVAKLRRTLEQERIERNQRQASRFHSSHAVELRTQASQLEAPSQLSKPTVPRKSSMKDLTSRSIKRTQNIAAAVNTDAQADHRRRHSETSVVSARNRRRGLNTENMTSAFIVPDITIRNRGAGTQNIPELSRENQEILNGLATHDGRNCTVCKRSVGVKEYHDHDDAAKATVTIPKPVLVSDRMPEAGPYEEEPTIRPSQAPGIALAIVLKGLEDEVSHLKIQLAKNQALYNGHDPALRKRRRQSVSESMDKLKQSIEVKSDQIYSLYDVLEGQKQDGHLIGEKEVEITLQSVGIDTPGLCLRGGGDEGEEKEGKAERHPWDLSSDDQSNDDLPWEGIESTVETTKSGFARANRRRSVVA